MIKSVLILEAGGPAAISCIKRIRKNFPDIRIIGADMDANSAGLRMSDFGIVVPSSSDPTFAETVLKLLKKYEIDLVLPCFENAFNELSNLKGPFVTDFENAIICKDKLKFNEYCVSLGLPVPETFLINVNSNPKKFPQYIKPRFGVGSRDNYIINSLPEFIKFKDMNLNKAEFISQDFIEGDHWNIDVMADADGYISSIERKDLKQKDGNCITVDVMTYEPLAEFSKVVQEKFNITSPFNLEVFEVSEGNFIINEINLRFGGGIIFGALAGRDFVSYLISKDVKYLGQIERGVYTRYYEEALIKKK